MTHQCVVEDLKLLKDITMPVLLCLYPPASNGLMSYYHLFMAD